VLSLLGAVGAGAFSPLRGVVLAATLTVLTGLAGHRYRARAGGVTGDFLGASEQLGELAALAVLAWQAP
jgi:adenosylcobinamide-GDP ribazoletransferase